MAEPSSNDGPDGMPMLSPTRDPAQYTRPEAKQRFAVAKFYGMGGDGEWKVPEIADALDCSERQVRRYLNESEIAKEVREVLAITEAEWRLDMALKLRKTVQRLEGIEQELMDRSKAVPTSHRMEQVEGTHTGDANIRLSDDTPEYEIEIPVADSYKEVTDYGADLERVQKEKRQYLSQIADLLGLNESDQRSIDETLAGRADEVKIVEVRQSDDPYPEAEAIDMADDDAEPSDVIDVEATDVSDAGDGDG